MSLKEEFIDIYNENIKRDGAQELLSWMETTDFFVAPASTKYHCACHEGLLKHSLNVYKVMMDKHFDKETDNIESATISTLLHDICKSHFYKVSTRNVKKNRHEVCSEHASRRVAFPQHAVSGGESSLHALSRLRPHRQSSPCRPAC